MTPRPHLALLPALACVLGGCAKDAAEFPYFYVTVTAIWPDLTDSPATLGYWAAVQVTKKLDDNGDCKTIPAATRVVVDGVEAVFAPDAAAGCMTAEVRSGPFLQSQTVSVDVEQDGRSVGQATFAKLMPGTAATLTSPGDGLHAGDDIVIDPVPELPARDGSARFYPLDETTWRRSGLPATTTRLLDGMHVQVPPFAGRAWLIVTTPDDALGEVSCTGVAACRGQAASAL